MVLSTSSKKHGIDILPVPFITGPNPVLPYDVKGYVNGEEIF